MSFRFKPKRARLRLCLPCKYIVGVEVAEFESLNLGAAKSNISCSSGIVTEADVWREGLVVNSTQTRALCHYTDSFFGALGYAAMTKSEPNGGSSGEVIYVGAGIDKDSLVSLAAATIKRQGVLSAGPSTNPNVEQLLRKDRDGKIWHVAINHGEVAVSDADGTSTLSPFEVSISGKYVI